MTPILTLSIKHHRKQPPAIPGMRTDAQCTCPAGPQTRWSQWGVDYCAISIWLRTNIMHAGISICWIPKVEAIVLVPLSIGTCRRSDMVGVDRTPVSLLPPWSRKNISQSERMVENRNGRKQNKQVQVSILSWTWSGTNKTCVLLQHLERLCSANSGFTCAAQTILEPRCWLSALPQKE